MCCHYTLNMPRSGNETFPLKVYPSLGFPFGTGSQGTEAPIHVQSGVPQIQENKTTLRPPKCNQGLRTYRNVPKKYPTNMSLDFFALEVLHWTWHPLVKVGQNQRSGRVHRLGNASLHIGKGFGNLQKPSLQDCGCKHGP